MKQVRSVAVSFDCMLRDIKKIILLTLTHPVKLGTLSKLGRRRQ